MLKKLLSLLILLIAFSLFWYSDAAASIRRNLMRNDPKMAQRIDGVATAGSKVLQASKEQFARATEEPPVSFTAYIKKYGVSIGLIIGGAALLVVSYVLLTRAGVLSLECNVTH